MAHVRATIGGDTTEYRRAIRGMEGTTRSATARLGRMFASVGIAAAAIRFGRSIIQWASDASIAARNTGILTSELIALNRVGIQSGLRMNDMQRMLARMQTELFRAAEGSEQSRKKFERMGLEITDLARMDPAQMFQAVAKAAFETGIPIANLAELFGERLGPTAMVALREIAENGLPEVDEAIGRNADRIEAMGSKWAELGDQARGFALHIVNALDVAHTAISGFISGPMGDLAEAMVLLRDRQFSEALKRFREIGAAGGIMRSGMASARSSLAEREERIERQARRREEERSAQRDQLAALADRTEAGRETAEAVQESARIQAATIRAISDVADPLRRMGAMSGTGASQVEEQTRLDRTRNETLTRIATAMDTVNRFMGKVGLGMR